MRHADGTLYGRSHGDSFPFDPGVLIDDDERIYLYSGFYTPVPAIVTGGKKLKYEGGYVMELENDMLTIRGEEKLLFPKDGEGAFKNHELCWAVSNRPTEGVTYGGTLISNGNLFLQK